MDPITLDPIPPEFAVSLSDSSLAGARAWDARGLVRMLRAGNTKHPLTRRELTAEEKRNVRAVAGRWTPMHLAASRGDVETMARHLGMRDAVAEEGETPLTLAMDAGKWEAARWLLEEAGARPDPPGADANQVMTPLCVACGRRRVDLTEALLRAGARVTSLSLAFLMHASPSPSVGTSIRLLLDHVADESEKARLASRCARMAVRARNHPAIRFFLDDPPDPNFAAETVFVAIGADDVLLLRDVADAGYDMDSRDPDGRSVLWFARRVDPDSLVVRCLSASAY